MLTVIFSTCWYFHEHLRKLDDSLRNSVLWGIIFAIAMWVLLAWHPSRFFIFFPYSPRSMSPEALHFIGPMLQMWIAPMGPIRMSIVCVLFGLLFVALGRLSTRYGRTKLKEALATLFAIAAVNVLTFLLFITFAH